MNDERRAARLERIVSRLLRNQKLDLDPADAEERRTIMAAARLAAARESFPAMSPEFRRRLQSRLAGTPQAGWMTRRSALVAGLGMAAGTLAGFELEQRVTGRAGVVQEPSTIDPRPGRWVDVAALADLPEGQGVRVTAGAVGAFVFRRGAGVTAVSSVCSHLPCELGWEADRSILLCPCHNQGFTAEGQSTSELYPLPPLHQVRSRVVEGRVELLGT